MGVAERKSREQTERKRRITEAARRIAATEGWSAVTVRRLAEEIEYSQPVIYSHFENRDAIVAAVAVDGFRELATALREASHGARAGRAATQNVARAYLAFAKQHPAVYQAMFTLPTDLHFAKADTLSELKDAFAALAAVIPPSSHDAESATETFWAALHGLAELERSGRIRPGARDARLALVVQGLLQD